MEVFWFSFNATVPLFVVAGVGYFLKRVGILSAELAGPLNALCFKVLIPCSLFRTAMTATLSPGYGKLAVFMLSTLTAAILVMCWLVPKRAPSRRQAAAVIQGAFRSNLALLCLPLALNLCGDVIAPPMVVVLAVMIPALNIAAVLLLSSFSETDGRRPKPGKVMRDLASNPLILSTLLGLAAAAVRLELPTVIYKPISDLAASAVPLSMLVMGAQFNFGSFVRNRGLIALSAGLKLVVMPLTFTLLAIALGFDSLMVCVVYLAYAVPCASSSVPMTAAMGGDSALAGEILLAETALAGPTLFIGVCILRAVGLV